MIFIFAIAERLQIPVSRVLDMTEAEVGGLIAWSEIAPNLKTMRGNRWPLKQNTG